MSNTAVYISRKGPLVAVGSASTHTDGLVAFSVERACLWQLRLLVVGIFVLQATAITLAAYSMWMESPVFGAPSLPLRFVLVGTLLYVPLSLVWALTSRRAFTGCARFRPTRSGVMGDASVFDSGHGETVVEFGSEEDLTSWLHANAVARHVSCCIYQRQFITHVCIPLIVLMFALGIVLTGPVEEGLQALDSVAMDLALPLPVLFGGFWLVRMWKTSVDLSAVTRLMSSALVRSAIEGANESQEEG